MSQLFGMDFSSLVNRTEGTNARKADKTESVKNTIGKPEISKETAAYYEQLKAKYGNVEFVLVEDEQIGNAKQLANRVNTDKELIVLVSESELKAMATDEATRTKNEQLISDAIGQMPKMKEELKNTGVDVKSFGMEFNDDGTVTYFAVLKDASKSQKERIEAQRAESKADKAEQKEDKVKSYKTGKVVSASSLEELIQKLKDVAYTEKADTIITEQEKMVGQHFDMKF